MSPCHPLLRLAVAATLLALPGSALGHGATPRGGEVQVLRLLNVARAAHGLGPLRLSPGLRRAAGSHSREMIREAYFGHGALAQRLARFYHRTGAIGEDIAWGAGGDGTPGRTVRRWLASPPHRAVLLSRGFHVVGVGSATGAFLGVAGATVYTADFGG